MIRHLKNFQELAVYGGVSCAVAFFVRINPAFFYPVLLLRISILLYCFYIIALTENQKNIAVILSAAIFIGWLGSSWDLIEIYFNFDFEGILTQATVILGVCFLGLCILFGVKNAQTK